MNPLDEFLALKHGTKTAAPHVPQGVQRFGRSVGHAAAVGLGTAAAGAAVAGVGVAASKVYDAITKARDFKSMLASPYNSDLHEMHSKRPKDFNSAFSTLRTINPAFTRDPMIAGTYMRRFMEFDPRAAGGVALEALSRREEFPESPIMNSFQRGAVGGAQAGMMDGMKDPHAKTREMAMAQYFKGLPSDIHPQDQEPLEGEDPNVKGDRYLYEIGTGKRRP